MRECVFECSSMSNNFLSLLYRLLGNAKSLLFLAVQLPDEFFGQSLELISLSGFGKKLR